MATTVASFAALAAALSATLDAVAALPAIAALPAVDAGATGRRGDGRRRSWAGHGDWRRHRAADVESHGRLMGRRMIGTTLFLEEVSPRLQERRQLAVVVRHHRDGVGELVGEHAEHGGDEAAVGHRHATVEERVGERVEAGEVIRDGEVVLMQAVELL